MKVTIEFNLPEESADHHFAIHGKDYWLAAWDVDEWLRRKLKYAVLSDEQYAAYDACRSMLRDCVEAHGVSLDEPA